MYNIQVFLSILTLDQYSASLSNLRPLLNELKDLANKEINFSKREQTLK